MANVSIIDVLSAPNLGKLIDLSKQGLPDIFPKQFTKIHKQVDRDYCEWKTQLGSRATSLVTEYGAPGKDQQQTNLGVQTAKAVHFHDVVNLPVADFVNLCQYESLEKQDMGMQEVRRQALFATTRLKNNRNALQASAIFQGNIWLDQKGSILPTSSGANVTIPFNIPSGNQGQLNVLGQGNILTSPWSDSNANIAGQVRNLRVAMMRLTGYNLKFAFYGQNVPDYLANNTSLQTYFSRGSYPSALYPNGIGQEYVYSSDLPPNLLGLVWVPAYLQYYLDSSSTPQSFVGPDEVVFTTDPDEGPWLQNMEGSYPIPQKYGVSSVDAAISDNYKNQYGMSSWAHPSLEVPSATLHFIDQYLPAITNGSCILQGTVNFAS